LHFAAALWLAAFILLSSLIGAFLVFRTKNPEAEAPSA
jgi:hypothetical protein